MFRRLAVRYFVHSKRTTGIGGLPQSDLGASECEDGRGPQPVRTLIETWVGVRAIHAFGLWVVYAPHL